ncbi:hypothetical protein AAUPMB_00750, partial [Pasteurella multocida subsp. multocida str. Anand1_buffalo]
SGASRRKAEQAAAENFTIIGKTNERNKRRRITPKLTVALLLL